MVAAPTPAQASFDFLQPFMSAAIKTRTGTYPLWTRGSNNQTFTGLTTEPGLSDLQALSFLTELTVEMNLGQVPIITATLSPPFADAIKFYDSTLIESTTNTLSVQFGYANGSTINGVNGPILSPIFEGILLRPEASYGTDSQIVLHAQGTKSYSMLQLQNGKTYPTQTLKALVTSILVDQGYIADFSAVVPGSNTDTIFSQTVTYSMAWNTPLAAVYDLCRQARCRVNLNYTPNVASGSAAFTGGNAYIVPVSNDAVVPPDFTLSMFNYPSGSLGGATYPILSVSTDNNGLYLPGVGALMLSDVDELSKKHVTRPVSDADTKATRSGPAGGNISSSPAWQAPDLVSLSGYIRRSGDPGDPTAVQQAQSAFEVHTRAMGVALNVESLGIPIVFPGMVAAVVGLGYRLSSPYAGTYGIRKVTHTLSTGGYSTSMEMTSNVGSLLSKQIALPSDGSYNTQDTPPGTSGQSTTVQPTVSTTPSTSVPAPRGINPG